MSSTRDPLPADEDPRLMQTVQAYLDELEAGRRPDREAFLARHPDLAETMQPYLEALELVHTNLPSVPASEPSPPAADEAIHAEALGDFRIVREIGRGGMGVVYEAVQRSLGRRVALKVLPFAAALDTRQLQRFKNEAQAAAHLHHPNIVPVYAVGMERGVHFYAMQMIDGQNLATLIQDLRGRADAAGRPVSASRASDLPPPVGSPSTLAAQLSTQRSERGEQYFRAVARLIAQAAGAIDHAHAVGIVHRDLKPANLLIDQTGNVWVTDFGLAQFHTDAGLTQTGDLVGTLRYMSPEQAGGQHRLIDHRTDVYALGATLYELLTLRPLFDATDRQTLLQEILHREPRPPRSVDPAVPPELETIALKALGKAPADRYATARELADDLHRYLRHEPILARRPTAVQRVRKWLRRHPSVLVGGGVLLVLLSAGSLVSAWLIRGEQEKTRQAYERERLRAEQAEASYRLARRSVDEMVQMAEEELTDKPFMDAYRKRLLESALVYYQEFIEQRRDDPDARTELLASRARVKRIVDDLALLQTAGTLSLLTEPRVLKELNLSDGQRDRLAELSRQLEAQREEWFRPFHRLTPEERGKYFLELARTNEAAAAAILKPEQMRRLQQIALQCQGPRAFQEPEVVTALRLTAEQRERIRTIEAELMFGKPPDRQRPGRGPDGPPRRPMEQSLRTATQRIQALLTGEQKKRWTDLTGEPIPDAALLVRPPPRGPFGPPPH